MKEQHIFSKNSTYQLIEVLKTNSSYEAPAFPACNHAVHTYAGAKGRPIAGKKITALDFQGLCCGGDSWTRTNGLTSLRLFGQVRNRRTDALERRLYLLLTTLPPSLHPPLAALGSAPHDVNDVL